MKIPNRRFSQNARRFAVNALMLIAVNLFMRTVGVSFNVYLSRRAGGEVMGLYSLLLGVYGLAMTLGCAGINLGTTRMVADVMGTTCPPETTDRPRLPRDRGAPTVAQPANASRSATAHTSTTVAASTDTCHRAIRRVLGRCIAYSLVCGIGAGLLLFFFAPLVGTRWLGDARTVSSLRVLALTLPPIALSSCLGGYFTAVRRIGKNAAVGILGQLLRIGFCTYLLTLWLPDGVEMTCMALVLGGALSELCGFLLNLAAFLYDRNRYLSDKAIGGTTSCRVSRKMSPHTFRLPSPADVCATSDHSHAEQTEGQRETETETRKLLGITVPVTLSACVRSGLLTLQHILIPKGLKASGASWESALASYGVVHGMVLPVVLFPSAFINSYSGLLVPEVAESWARGDHERVSRLAYKVITPALIFSIGVAGIMASFGRELGMAIYGSAEAGRYIRVLAPLIPIMYVDSSVDAFLKGMGEQVYSMNVNILDALCSVLLVWALLPKLGIWGYIVAIYATETLNTTLSLARMLRLSGMRIRLWQQVAAPLLSVVGATVLCRILGMATGLMVTGTLGLVVAIALCGAGYVGIVGIMGRGTKERENVK